MILSIFPGSHFSRMKLVIGTNKFFNNARWGRIISGKDTNYAVKIGKRSIKIITSDCFSENDVNIIKKYIETVFRDRSILIDSTDNL